MNDQNITKHLKFPFTYDEKALTHDLSLILQEKWIPHFNTAGYEGDWNVIPLYAKSGNESNIFALSMDDSTVVETPIMNHCLYFKKVIASFKFPILSARLLKLGVGAAIKPHCDHDLGYEDNCFRLHIPIITNDNVNFILDGNQLKMLPGECWYTNVNYTHSVVNNGTTNRVHLVIDGERNAWSDDLFFSLAPKESFFPNKKETYDSETLKRIIEELKHSDLHAAKELIIANELLLLKQIAKVEVLQKLKKSPT